MQESKGQIPMRIFTDWNSNSIFREQIPEYIPQTTEAIFQKKFSLIPIQKKQEHIPLMVQALHLHTPTSHLSAMQEKLETQAVLHTFATATMTKKQEHS